MFSSKQVLSTKLCCSKLLSQAAITAACCRASFGDDAQPSEPGCNRNHSVSQQQTSLQAKSNSVFGRLLQTQGAYKALKRLALWLIKSVNFPFCLYLICQAQPRSGAALSGHTTAFMPSLCVVHNQHYGPVDWYYFNHHTVFVADVSVTIMSTIWHSHILLMFRI